jgi:mono/diheme cytochrome c family protein
VRLVALGLLASMAGCAEPDAMPASLPASPTAMIFTGDAAGAADRGAELIANPYTGDAVARQEGKRLYREMNCMYCHRSGGEGGMGPSLIDSEWLFGNTSADRFMSVWGGRARGMPAYGRMLPDESIWKIVAYIEQLHEEAGGEPFRAGGRAASESQRSQQPPGVNRP